MSVIYIRTEDAELRARLISLAQRAQLPIAKVAEALIARGLGVSHPHYATIRYALRKDPQQ